MRTRRRFYLVVGLLVAVVLAACGASRTQNLPPPDPPPQIAPTDEPLDGDPGGIPANQPPQNLRFERIGIEDGLSHSAVWKILQDSEGYIWFGTQDGLNRYNGHSFTVYRHDPDNPHYGVGFAVGQTLLVTLVGVLVAAAILAFVLLRSPWHGKEQEQGAREAA